MDEPVDALAGDGRAGMARLGNPRNATTRPAVFRDP
jgi:hypothetical protein